MKVVNLMSAHLIAIVCSLLSMFGVTGLLDVLQSNNASEFSNIARNSKTIHFTPKEISIIIRYYYQIWSGMKQIPRTLRHSPSNGGIEMLNKTFEGKMSN